MKFLVFICACLLSINVQAEKPATIKVLIERSANDALLEVKGRYQIYNPLDGVLLTSGVLSKRAPVLIEEYGLNWGEKFPGTYQIRIVPGDSQSSILVGGIQYNGCIEIYHIDGKLNVVNEIDVENYLKSTLTEQFLEPLEDEVMSAIAIVARTNAYYTAKKNPKAFWHVTASEVDYQGSAVILHKPFVDRAVETTRHAIMVYNNAPFAATWTRDSAGKTADFSSVFRKAVQSPPGVQAPLAARDREQHKWTFSTPKQALAQTANLEAISSIDLFLASDKVYGIKLSSGKRSNEIDFFTLQKILGKSRLRSNDFTVSLKGDQIIFTGYGEGTGVGLCLYSAELMAEKGNKASKILSTFFPDTQIEKVRSLKN